MHLQFLGAATTVTGSQFLLETARARILVDCGMFQGSPNESIRNRIPLAYDPKSIDAILLTHAHLDHCGLIPCVVAQGYRGPIYATAGTAELARLVLLDSGKLQAEFAKRGERFQRRHPDRAAAEHRVEEQQYADALELAQEGAAGMHPQGDAAHPRAAAGGEDDVPPPLTVGSATPDAAVSTGATSEISPAGSTWTAPAPIASMAAEARAPESDDQPSPALMVPSEDLILSPVRPRFHPDEVRDGQMHTVPDPEHALRNQPPLVEVDLDEPLYDEEAALEALRFFRPLGYDREQEVAPGVHATFVDAGHILGSAIIRLRASDADSEPDVRIVFSGDLGRTDTPIIRDPTIVTDADYVLIESTYGGREHEPQDEAVQVLADTVRLVAEHDGVLLVPSFAIGRTQEVVWQLDRLLSEGRIPELPLYLDSPMASKASDVYRHHADYFDDETRKLLQENESPLDYPNQHITNDVRQSQAIARSPRPYMIVASNGMLTGGRVVGHLRELIDDPSAVLLFVGYQGEGTLGAHLQAGAKTVKIDGNVRNVRCQIRSISGFSAHADESELLSWIGNFAKNKSKGDPGFPRKVFVVHGDPEAQQALAPKIGGLGFDVVVPEWREIVELS
jgi:metallo-beta-lactamase family protein